MLWPQGGADITGIKSGGQRDVWGQMYKENVEEKCCFYCCYKLAAVVGWSNLRLASALARLQQR